MVSCYYEKHSECGVTANILVLGTKDSGFESLHSDNMVPDIGFEALQVCATISSSRDWFSGRIPAFQAGDKSSILLSRTIYKILPLSLLF